MPTPQPVAGYPLALFLHRSVFRGPAKYHPARGLRRPPPDRKTPGEKGKKAALRASFPDGPPGRPAPLWQHRWKRPGGRTDQALRRAGRQARNAGPETIRNHGNRPWLSLLSTPTPTLARAGDHGPGCRPHGRMGINERATNTKQRPSGNTAGGGKPISGRCDAGFKGLRSAHKQRGEPPGQQARGP